MRTFSHVFRALFSRVSLGCRFFLFSRLYQSLRRIYRNFPNFPRFSFVRFGCSRSIEGFLERLPATFSMSPSRHWSLVHEQNKPVRYSHIPIFPYFLHFRSIVLFSIFLAFLLQFSLFFTPLALFSCSILPFPLTVHFDLFSLFTICHFPLLFLFFSPHCSLPFPRTRVYPFSNQAQTNTFESVDTLSDNVAQSLAAIGECLTLLRNDRQLRQNYIAARR